VYLWLAIFILNCVSDLLVMRRHPGFLGLTTILPKVNTAEQITKQFITSYLMSYSCCLMVHVYLGVQADNDPYVNSFTFDSFEHMMAFIRSPERRRILRYCSRIACCHVCKQGAVHLLLNTTTCVMLS
jgi:hypothetical protein